jgi:hypothetical protein
LRNYDGVLKATEKGKLKIKRKIKKTMRKEKRE